MSQGFAKVTVPFTGISAGTQFASSGSIVFANSNGVTFGMSGSSQITASVAGPSLGISNLGNTSGTSGLLASNLLLIGSNNITLSQSTVGSTVAVNIIGRSNTADYYENMQYAATASGAVGGFAFTGSHRSLFVIPINGLEEAFPVDISAGTMFWNLSQSGSTATMSVAFTSQLFWGIYTANGSSLSLQNSGVVSWGFGAAATNNSTAFVAQRYLSVHSSLWSSSPTFFFGSRYYLAWFWSSAGAVNQSVSLLGGYRYSTVQRSGTVGVSQAGSTTQGWAPWYGVYASTTSALPANISSNQLNKVNANAGFVPHVVFANAAASTVF